MERGFEERRKKNEDKWALDEQLRFKAVARRNKLLGHWAASEMGLTGEQADDYAKAVIAAQLHGEDRAFRKVFDDLRGAGLPHTEALVQRKLDELAAVARDQIRNGV